MQKIKKNDDKENDDADGDDDNYNECYCSDNK